MHKARDFDGQALLLGYRVQFKTESKAKFRFLVGIENSQLLQSKGVTSRVEQSSRESKCCAVTVDELAIGRDAWNCGIAKLAFHNRQQSGDLLLVVAQLLQVMRAALSVCFYELPENSEPAVAQRNLL